MLNHDSGDIELSLEKKTIRRKKREGRMTEKDGKDIPPQVIESGTITLGEGILYFYEVVFDSGTFRKYAFRPGECVELDPWTNEFIGGADSYSPSSMDPKDYPPKRKVTKTGKKK